MKDPKVPVSFSLSYSLLQRFNKAKAAMESRDDKQYTNSEVASIAIEMLIIALEEEGVLAPEVEYR